ncbi:hypothetical protein [Glycomyces xiaoerkulensis]|uniref:hypothetical protein n=1 Tax=Glycomyces xiaoerkulensis TaxID=2038139 RepID=UPI000C25A7DE|nr:hypothetical protein [Glycomyces xiaoerkulensis]
MPVPITERADRLPRLPFLVTLAVSALLLAVAVDHEGYGADDRVTTVEELPLAESEGALLNERDGDSAEVEIVESGFGMVADVDGERRGTVGAVVRNSGSEAATAVFGVRSRIDGDTNLFHTQLNAPWIPPGEEIYLGSYFQVPQAVPDASALSLEIDNAYEITGGETGPLVQPQRLPEFAVTGTAPLFVPEGTRIVFTADVPTDAGLWSTAAVLFRDASGEIVGGLSGAGRPLADPDHVTLLPQGDSEQHLDVPEHAIPEEADLDRVEVGPSTW